MATFDIRQKAVILRPEDDVAVAKAEKIGRASCRERG